MLLLINLCLESFKEMSASFCDTCHYPTAVESCASAFDCERLRICGLVNQTEVLSLTKENDNSTLYIWRLLLSNCGSKKMCDAKLSLALNWKYRVDSLFQDWVGALNPVDAAAMPLFPLQNAYYSIETNIPGAAPVSGTGAWNGETLTQLFNGDFVLPPGQWIVKVSLEIKNKAMPVNCPRPVLFPALAQLQAFDPSEGACPASTSALVGCSPDNVVLDVQLL